MSAYLSPLGGAGWQFLTSQGLVLAGGKIFTYVAGSTTLQATWTDSTQATLNANPIILNSAGRPPSEIWLGAGSNNYKFTITDSNGANSQTFDNITGIAASNSQQSEWLTSGFVVTYVSGTSFTVPGNQTAILNVNRRVQYVLNSGTFYGTVLTSVYDGSSLTTITITPDTTNFDNTLATVNYGFMSATNTSVPVIFIPSNNAILTGNVNMAGATTVTVPTVAGGDNSTKAVNTAYLTTALISYAPLASPAFTGAPTAPTAPPGTNTTQLATMAAIQAQAFSAALPAQAGQAGKFVTTNGASASWAVPGIAAVTSTAGSTSITLTSASAGYQSFAPTALGKSIILPDATTLTVGGPVFILKNDGGYPWGVRSNGNALLTGVAAGGDVMMFLKDNSTAAGLWSFVGNNLEPGLVGLDTSLDVFSVATGSLSITQCSCMITPTLGVISAPVSGGGFKLLLIDFTPGSNSILTSAIFPSATAVPAGIFATSSSSFVVFYVISGFTEAATFTGVTSTGMVSGGSDVVGVTTIFDSVENGLNTPTIAALSPTLYVAFSHTGSDIKATAISIGVSGGTLSTVTFGTTVAKGSVVVTSCCGAYAASATQAMVVYGTSTPTIIGDSVTVSGTNTVTWGTASSGITVAVSGTLYPTAQLTPAKVIASYASTTTIQKACCFSLAGTTVTANAELSVETSLTATVSTTYTTLSKLGGATANRFNPILQPLTATTMLLQYSDNNAPTPRVAVLSESSGTLTIPGGILKGTLGVNPGSANLGGCVIGSGKTEFIGINQVGYAASTSSQNKQVLVPHKINGAAITTGAGEFVEAGGNVLSNILSLLPIRFSNGNYAIYGNNVSGSSTNSSQQIPVFSTNGDYIKDRGFIRCPQIFSAQQNPISIGQNNMVVMGNNVSGGTSIRLLAIEVAA